MKRIPCSGSLALPALLCCLPLVGTAAKRAPWPTGPTHELSARPTQVVSGRITDDKGEGLPGVTVLVKGTTTGTSTGADGTFSLDVPDGATLVISSIGYVNQEIAVAGRTSVNVSLATDNQQLGDVVVLGYVSQDRQNLSSAVAPVDVVAAKRAPVATITEAIQGRTTGVQIYNGGTPGQAPIVNIRGIGTLNGGSAPLYVIDGLWTSTIRDLNPSDIESLTVLKDASSTSIYGSSGANGVVIITTKKGKAGKPVLGFNAYAGVQNTVDRWDLTNASEWAAFSSEAYRNAGLTPLASAQNPANYADTDWQAKILRTGTVQDYNLNFSGGSNGDKYTTNFLVSGGFFNQKGALIGTDFKRYTLRLNSGLTVGRLKLSEAVQLTHARTSLPTGAPFQDAIRLLPTIPVYDSTEAPVFTAGYGYGNAAANTFGTNPVAAQLIRDETQYNNRLQGSINAEYSFFDFLSYRLNVGVDNLAYTDRNARKFGRTNQNQPQNEYQSFLLEQRGDNSFLILENILNFNKRIGDHGVNVILGYSEQRGRNEYIRGVNRGYGNGPNYNFQLSAGTTGTELFGEEFENAKRSYFTQAVYDYKNRYLLTGSFRRDGSSRFNPDNRYGNFGAGSIGWRISEESFIKESAPFISNLKARFSYGVNGNDGIGEYQFQGVINQNANYVLDGNALIGGSIQTYIPSDNIKWESRYTTNYGMDLGLFDNRISLSADYYVSRTEDALVNPLLPIYLGSFGPPPFVNIGDIENKGFELQLGYQDNRSAFTYGISGNLTTIKNEVLRLSAEGQNIPSGVTRTQAGHPVGSFFLIPFDGVFQTQEEVTQHVNADGKVIQPYAAPGDARYRDSNGDGVINDSDRIFYDTSVPKIQYGVSANAGYKGVDVSLLFQGVGGNQLFNIARATMDRTDDPSNFRADFTPWRPDAPSTTTPRALQGGGITPQLQEAAASNARGSSRFLENGSYLRLKNIQIGYTFPQSLTGKVKGFNSLRVYVTGQNVLTFSKYSGPDPEVVNGNFFERGVDFSSFPNLRTFTGGVQLGF
ncbi:SusC/RagA family TonB-linked outer membrane protein [uncultured Hymenobacter sp.]|uniref:SusC/RagA family TonB-linked outer membrane protein n=1 Tax=uncultured Hymenobacter sp. TaxID=170016 RepID=UPI0035CA7BB3